MSGNDSQEQQAEATPEAPAPVSDGPEPSAGRPRRRTAAVLGTVLLAGAVLAGVGYTVVTVKDADRDAGAPVWTFPKDKAEQKKAAPATGLAGLLVPYGSDWSRGPDLGEFGYDVEFTGAQAAALRKEALRGLPRTLRKRLEKKIDSEHIKGSVMRSYARQGGDSALTVRVEATRMGSRAAVQDNAQTDFLDTLDIFRKGPEIKGHKNARCFLPPKDTDEDLDMMVCSAAVGDVLVTATASGVKPFDTKGVAVFLREQLDRIGETGEAV